MKRTLLADVTPLKESREFRLFYFGNAASSIGRQLTLVAAPIQLFAITENTLLVGLLGLSQFPALLIGSMAGGSFSDAWDRRRVLLVAQVLLLVTSAALAINAMLPNPQIWLIFVLMSSQAFFFSIDGPARFAAIPRLVPPQRIAAAYALLILLSQSAKAIGPILAGLIIVWFNVAAAYWIDAFTFVVAIGSLVAMKAMPAADGGTKINLRSIMDGFRFLRDRKAIQGAFLIDINATMFGVPRALFPEMGLTIFGGSEAIVGLLFAAPGFGAFLGAATSGWVGAVKKAGKATTIAVVIWGIAIAGFGFSPNLTLALGFLVIAGAADAISSVFRATIVQLTTPDHLRGRLSGLKIAAVGGGPRLGDAEAGLVSQAYGPSVAAWSGGFASAIGAVVIAKVYPTFYNWVTPEEGELGEG